MFCRRKVRLAALLLGVLLCLGFLHSSRWHRVRALLGLPVSCRESDAAVMEHLHRVQPRCVAWPRQNPFFVAQGMLQRNRRLVAASRCYLLALDGATARVLSHEASPVHATLLRIECHTAAARSPLRLLLPSVPLPPHVVARAALRDPDQAWDVLVLGLGGLTHRLWEQMMPQAAGLVAKEMRGALVSRLQPMSDAPEFDLMQLLRGDDGKWITTVFADRGYTTQAGVLNHEGQEPFSSSVPATVNLSDYLEARASLRSPGCVGSVSEGSMALSWVREMMLLYAPQHRVMSLLHLADLVFPSTKRIDAEFVSILLEYLHFECFSRTALLLYSLPDARSGFEPGVLIFHPPPRLLERSSFRWDMIRSALGVGDFFTPADINRVLAFLASDQKPSVLAPIGRNDRTCANMRVEGGLCRCQRLES